MVDTQQHKPVKLQTDLSYKSVKPEESPYLLNQERFLNANNSMGKRTPAIANEQFSDIDFPVGENYCIGAYESKQTNEIYSFHWNSNLHHSILRHTEITEIVYQGQCLELDEFPEYAITQFRVWVRVEKNKKCANRHGVELIWTIGKGRIHCLDVEASILTESFTTINGLPTSFFSTCTHECDYTLLAVPETYKCPTARLIESTDQTKANFFLENGYKFRIKPRYYDGREGEWGPYSSLYYINNSSCGGFTARGRCFELTLDACNAMVDTIDLSFSTDNGDTWKLYDTIKKYSGYTSDNQMWYERHIVLPGFDANTCTFKYTFCHDKQCYPVPAEDVSRFYNPEPLDAQCLFPIDSRLAFVNYRKGVCNIAKPQLDKISFDIIPGTASCVTEQATVKFSAVIHNHIHDRNQFIYRMNGVADNTPDDPADKAIFGGLNPSLGGGFENDYDQNFKDTTRNFIAYVEGTSYYAEMKQWKRSRNEVYEIGVIPNMQSGSTRNRWRRAARNGEVLYQLGEIKVPKGTKGYIRLASHFATGNEQQTSTYVWGQLYSLADYYGNTVLEDGSNFAQGVTEIYFDTCNGDVDLTDKSFVIADLAIDDGLLTEKHSVIYGYVKDKAGGPVENLELDTTGSVGPVFSAYTDHNGFYFLASEGEIDIDIKGEVDCGTWDTLVTVPAGSWDAHSASSYDAQIADVTYSTDRYSLVKLKVLDCNGIPLVGIPVAVQGSKAAMTNTDGIATIQCRNVKTRNRFSRVVVMRTGGCLVTDCNNTCNPCMPDGVAIFAACFVGRPVVNMPNATLSTFSYTDRGLKANGKYEMGFVVRGGGRVSFVQTNDWFLDIPSTQSKNGWSFPSIRWQMSTPVFFPDWAESFSFFRSKNLNGFQLQWVVDKIEYIDALGNGAGVASAKQVRLTIQSLNDYNASYFFKTNTVYQYLDGDRVEFIQNGDGKIFQGQVLNFAINSPFLDKTYPGTQDQPADYFNQILVNNNSAFADLKEGAIIELQRPQQCEAEPRYFEICGSIPIVNGMALRTTGILNTFDTYFVGREIKLKNVTPFTFEHHSPSDFWGTRLTDVGRQFIKNEKETDLRLGRYAALTDSIPHNRFNADQVKRFDGIEQGDIIAAYIKDSKQIFAVCEFDNMMAVTGDDFVRSSSDGIIRVIQGEQLISNPQSQISGAFGCSYEDVGSIFFGDDFFTFACGSSQGYIKHDYRQAVDVSFMQTKNWFMKRIALHESWNKRNAAGVEKYRWITGYNTVTKDVILTSKRLRDSGINNESMERGSNQTILFCPELKDFPSFASYTAEAYCNRFSSESKGCAFFAFLKGQPYLHPIKSTRFLEFFGQTVDWIVTICINKNEQKEKVASAVEVQDRQPWFISDIATDDPNFRSEVSVAHSEQHLSHWNIPMLSNINSIGGLFGEERPYGNFIKITFVRDNTLNLAYGTIDPAKRLVYSELDEIISKFTYIEQSGFTLNG